MTTAVREAPHHDNTVCIQWYSCTLPECRARFNTRRRELRAGSAKPRRILIDAAPIRQHILDLEEAGLSANRIAALAGVSHTTICAFLRAKPSAQRGRKKFTTPEIAERILAVKAVTSIGVARRLQALIAVGWTARRIAARMGMSSHHIVDLDGSRPVTLPTATKVAAIYAELRDENPVDGGVWPGHAERSRRRAKACRWPTPSYWDQHADDIDDPHFEPMYGVTRRELIAQDAHWLITTNGLDRATAAERLGVTKSYIDHAFRDHPEYALEVAA